MTTPTAAENGAEVLLPSYPARRDFSQRANLSELMDGPCTFEELRACLHEIANVNRLTFAYRPTLAWLDQLIAFTPLRRSRSLRILDAGCGYGDTLRQIHTWAAKRSIPVTLTGIDLNPDAIQAAKEATPTTQSIEWRISDALLYEPPHGADIIICSLFTHHLPDEQIIRFLSWMERTARCGWFINDLDRKPVPYHLFRLWARFSRFHRFVKHDGPVSILRSFVAEDWKNLCLAAEIDLESVSIKQHRPARLCVGRIK
jgi:2-polyprenyl-3-methyl-5-hydroxy-6-metoxy-1,4-benzoquinol methylase